MRRTFVVLSILLGLATSVISGYVVREYSFDFVKAQANGYGLCTGVSGPIAVDMKVSAGLPFKWYGSNFTKNLDACTGGISEKPTVTAVMRPYLKSWQFFINWSIWTVPFLGLLYFTFYKKTLKA